MSLTWHKSDADDTVSVKISGRFDFSVYQDLRNAYMQSPCPDRKFIIDLSDAEYMDSSALGMLLLLREYVGGERSSVKISGGNPAIKKVLEMANFARLFDIT